MRGGMRHRRSAKFAEYVATYAILERIGIHPTLLIEKRDSSVGFGVFVRDACDSGTCLLVVPSRRFCASSVLQAVSTPLPFPSSGDVDTADWVALDKGLFTHLTGSADAREWVECCWRLSMEPYRSCSPLWGWLESVPSAQEFNELEERAASHCRQHRPTLLEGYQRGRERLKNELSTAYRLLEPLVPTAPPAAFLWAGNVLLTRGRVLPWCWGSTEEGRSEETAVEVGVIPYVDLMSGADGRGRRANARVEVAHTMGELPKWYCDWVALECEGKAIPAAEYLTHVLRYHYFACVTLEKPLLPSDEVVLEYFQPVVAAESLQNEQDYLLLSRLLKFFF